MPEEKTCPFAPSCPIRSVLAVAAVARVDEYCRTTFPACAYYRRLLRPEQSPCRATA